MGARRDRDGQRQRHRDWMVRAGSADAHAAMVCSHAGRGHGRASIHSARRLRRSGPQRDRGNGRLQNHTGPHAASRSPRSTHLRPDLIRSPGRGVGGLVETLAVMTRWLTPALYGVIHGPRRAQPSGCADVDHTKKTRWTNQYVPAQITTTDPATATRAPMMLL